VAGIHLQRAAELSPAFYVDLAAGTVVTEGDVPRRVPNADEEDRDLRHPKSREIWVRLQWDHVGRDDDLVALRRDVAAPFTGDVLLLRQ
jgi:hypothetical protein